MKYVACIIIGALAGWSFCLLKWSTTLYAPPNTLNKDVYILYNTAVENYTFEKSLESAHKLYDLQQYNLICSLFYSNNVFLEFGKDWDSPSGRPFAYIPDEYHNIKQLPKTSIIASLLIRVDKHAPKEVLYATTYRLSDSSHGVYDRKQALYFNDKEYYNKNSRGVHMKKKTDLIKNEARKALIRATGKDFGYDKRKWRLYLVTQYAQNVDM